MNETARLFLEIAVRAIGEYARNNIRKVRVCHDIDFSGLREEH